VRAGAGHGLGVAAKSVLGAARQQDDVAGHEQDWGLAG